MLMIIFVDDSYKLACDGMVNFESFSFIADADFDAITTVAATITIIIIAVSSEIIIIKRNELMFI